MKFRFALLVAALALALSISAFAYSEEPAQDAAAPAQEETTTDDSTPFVLLRVYEGQFADVKDGDWFASPVISAYEYGLLNGRGENSFAPSGNVTIAELLTIAARLRAIYTTGSDAVIPTAKENEAWYAPYVSYLKSQNLLDNSFEGFYLLPASRAQMAGIFAFAVPEEWYTEPNASLVTTATASALTQAFTSCVKTYCEQMYNAVSCRSYSTGKVVLTFSSTACTDKTLESYRAKALAAAIKVHDSLWESGTLSYDMSQYEIARTYFQWLCDHCRYDNAAADDSASHLAYGALVSGLAVCDGYTGAYNLLLKLEGIKCTSLFNNSHIWTLATLDGTQYHIDVTWGDQYGRTDLRYFGMSEEQSYQCHPWGTADKKK